MKQFVQAMILAATTAASRAGSNADALSAPAKTTITVTLQTERSVDAEPVALTGRSAAS